MSVWRRASGPMEQRQVYIGGLVSAFIFSAWLFAKGQWKTGAFVGLWAPPFFDLADRLRERMGL